MHRYLLSMLDAIDEAEVRLTGDLAFNARAAHLGERACLGCGPYKRVASMDITAMGILHCGTLDGTVHIWER